MGNDNIMIECILDIARCKNICFFETNTSESQYVMYESGDVDYYTYHYGESFNNDKKFNSRRAIMKFLKKRFSDEKYTHMKITKNIT